jgi:four helix bundle protein
MEERRKIQNFTDLEAWRVAHQLVIGIYKLTQKYPQNEQFGIVNQMRRAAVSITSNIAEGFSRNSLKEKAQFYAIAKGSLTEVENQLLISRDIRYLSAADFERIEQEVRQSNKLITGLLKYARSA